MNIGIISYGAGNIKSIERALEFLGFKPQLVTTSNNLSKYQVLILPGVGSFPSAINKLQEKSLINAIVEFSRDNSKKLIGICLGMQLLLSSSEEFGSTKGLNLIPGKVIKISNNNNVIMKTKVPNIGWHELLKNEKSLKNNQLEFLQKITKNSYYFVHSYMCSLDDKFVMFNINYFGKKIPAIIKNKNIYGFQFHPEKSRIDGLNLLREVILS